VAHRLEDSVRLVRWTESYEASIHVGYHDCDLCNKESPAPTYEQLIAFAKARRDVGANGGFMWPGDEDPGCNPPRWMHVTDYGHICEECSAHFRSAMEKRRNAAGAPQEPPLFVSDNPGELQAIAEAAYGLCKTLLGMDSPPGEARGEISELVDRLLDAGFGGGK
jgi:hypothetical protein